MESVSKEEIFRWMRSNQLTPVATKEEKIESFLLEKFDIQSFQIEEKSYKK